MAEYKYPLDNQWKAARERLALLEAMFDPWTIRNFEKVGVREGWRCLEVAGGGGSIAEWLCRRVGPTGHVVATDLQPHFLEALDASNLEVLRHDLLRDPLPEATFDLVHARAVLTFLPTPAYAVSRLVAALKPGGWLLIEEPDYVSGIPDPSMENGAREFSQRAWDAMLSQLRALGYDTEFGRHLFHDAARAGLSNIQAEGFAGMQIGGTSSARFWKVTFEQLQEQIRKADLLSSTECEDYRTLLESPEYRWVNPIMMSVWGSRPPIV